MKVAVSNPHDAWRSRRFKSSPTTTMSEPTDDWSEEIQIVRNACLLGRAGNGALRWHASTEAQIEAMHAQLRSGGRLQRVLDVRDQGEAKEGVTSRSFQAKSSFFGFGFPSASDHEKLKRMFNRTWLRLADFRDFRDLSFDDSYVKSLKKKGFFSEGSVPVRWKFPHGDYQYKGADAIPLVPVPVKVAAPDHMTCVLRTPEGEHAFRFLGFVVNSLRVKSLHASSYGKGAVVEAKFTHREEHRLTEETTVSYRHERSLRPGENDKMTRVDAEELIWQCTMLLLAHEVDEKFQCNGKQVRDPHIDTVFSTLSWNYPDYDFRHEAAMRTNKKAALDTKRIIELECQVEDLKRRLAVAEEKLNERSEAGLGATPA